MNVITIQFIHEFVPKEWNQKPILNCNLIDLTEVSTSFFNQSKFLADNLRDESCMAHHDMIVDKMTPSYFLHDKHSGFEASISQVQL